MTTALPTFWARLRTRLQFFTQPAALPVVLLLLALSTVFLFGNDRGHFYRPGHHDWLSAYQLALATNLSPQHNFLLLTFRTLDTDDKPFYATYARYPIGSYALMKLAILPFWNDLSAKIYAARILMLILFSGSALLAYSSLARLVADRWIGLTATLVPFSSYASLYYADVPGPEIIPALFGVMLTFHGMVIYVQEARFRQLLVKTCVALVLCWNVYALLLPFIVLGLAGKLVETCRGLSVSSLGCQQLKLYGKTLLTSRYLTLGVVSLFFGLSLLSFNVVNTYFAYGGKLTLTQLPLVKSAISRSGFHPPFNEFYAKDRAYPAFLKDQFYHIAQLILPAVLNLYDDISQPIYTKDFLSVFGALMVRFCLIGIIVARHYKLLLTTFVLSGFCWTIPFRNQAILHDFINLYHIGIPLVFISLMMLYIRKLSSRQFIATLSVAALSLFVLSSAKMAGVGQGRSQAIAEAEILKDFEVIRNMVGERIVFVPSDLLGGQHGEAALVTYYFLSGSIVQSEHAPFVSPSIVEMVRGRRHTADYLILSNRSDGPALLTPDNRRIFLYDRQLFDDPSHEIQ